MTEDQKAIQSAAQLQVNRIEKTISQNLAMIKHHQDSIDSYMVQIETMEKQLEGIKEVQAAAWKYVKWEQESNLTEKSKG